MLNQSRRSKTALTLAVSVFLLVFSSNTSIASKNGTELQGNTFAVGINFKFATVDEICSGALIAPKLVVTSAHCVINENGIIATDFYFNKPGVPLDAPIDPTEKPIKIVKTYLHPGYGIYGNTQKDDIAFIELDSPLATTGFIKLATDAQLSQIKDKQALTGYGFGYVFETKDSYSNLVRSYPLMWRTPATATAETVQLESTSATACSGDSGSAITMQTSTGEELLVAILNRAANVVDRCGSASSDGIYTMQASVINRYLDIVPASLLQIPAPVATTFSKPTPTPTAFKRYKITCVKGKIKKYVTGTNPKCPSGFKLTAKTLLK